MIYFPQIFEDDIVKVSDIEVIGDFYDSPELIEVEE